MLKYFFAVLATTAVSRVFENIRQDSHCNVSVANKNPTVTPPMKQSKTITMVAFAQHESSLQLFCGGDGGFSETLSATAT